ELSRAAKRRRLERIVSAQSVETFQSSRFDKIDRSKQVHLTDIDACVAKDGVCHRDVKIDIRDRHLKQIVVSPYDFARRDPRQTHFTIARIRVLTLSNTFREIDRF